MSISKEDRHAFRFALKYKRATTQRRRKRIERAVRSLPLDARTLFAALTTLLLFWESE